jgi:hypothetical protein
MSWKMQKMMMLFFYGMYQYALHIEKHLNRAEYRQLAMTGLEW